MYQVFLLPRISCHLWSKGEIVDADEGFSGVGSPDLGCVL